MYAQSQKIAKSNNFKVFGSRIAKIGKGDLFLSEENRKPHIIQTDVSDIIDQLKPWPPHGILISDWPIFLNLLL
jgi:hypothetical protein